MEIHTNKRIAESAGKESSPPSEKGPYLRRKANQRLRRSNVASRRLVRWAKATGRLSAFVLAAAFVITLFVYAYTSDRFTVRTITFYGCVHQDPHRLEDAIRGDFPKNLLRIDLQALRDRLEREPWIKSVEIRRILPSELVIHVHERSPTVILEMNGELMLADDEGLLLDKYDPKYGKLDMPIFKGIVGSSPEEYALHQDENADRVKVGLNMLKELEAGSSMFTRDISEVDLSDRSNIRILLIDDTAELYLGDKDFLKRFSKFKANLPEYKDLKSQYKDIASVDLRYNGQIIYRPRTTGAAQGEDTAEVHP